MRKVIIEVSDVGSVAIEFNKNHFTKRELMRIIRAIKVYHRESIRLYQRGMKEDKAEKREKLLEEQKQEKLLKEQEDGINSGTETVDSKGEGKESNGSDVSTRETNSSTDSRSGSDEKDKLGIGGTKTSSGTGSSPEKT